MRLINNCDTNEPLLSSTKLGQQLDKIPLCKVQPASLSQLCLALNVEQLIPTKVGLARDFRGLAEQMGFSSNEIESRFRRSHNQTKSVLDALLTRNINSSNPADSRPTTVNDLLKMIELIERFDVIDDLLPILIDMAIEEARPRRPTGRDQMRNQPVALQAVRQDPNGGPISNLLTVDDTNRSRELYDAYICYTEEDTDYARELIPLLEARQCRVATRDHLMAGPLEHDALAELIDERCRMVVIIVTPNFVRSKTCEFPTKFAHELSIHDDGKRIIPVIYEPCDYKDLPYSIRHRSKVDMTRRETLQWEFDKLFKSLGLPNSCSPPRRQIVQIGPTNGLRSSIPQISLSSEPTDDDDDGAQAEPEPWPRVELFPSQSSMNGLSNQLSSMLAGEVPEAHREADRCGSSPRAVASGGPKSFFQSIKRKILGQSTSAHSASSSQAFLCSFSDSLSDNQHSS